MKTGAVLTAVVGGFMSTMAMAALQPDELDSRDLWGLTPLQETTYSEDKDLMAILFSRLIAFVECCVAVPANRIGVYGVGVYGV